MRKPTGEPADAHIKQAVPGNAAPLADGKGERLPGLHGQEVDRDRVVPIARRLGVLIVADMVVVQNIYDQPGPGLRPGVVEHQRSGLLPFLSRLTWRVAKYILDVLRRSLLDRLGVGAG